MESILLVPSFGVQRPRCGCNCPVQHGPGLIRPRYQYRRRWQPGFGLTPSSLLSHIFDDEPSLASLVLCLKDDDRMKREASASENKAKSSDNPKSYGSDADKKTPSQKEQASSDKFNVSIELSGVFAPEDISVKLLGRSLRVVAKHEESDADGHFSTRHIFRTFHLPDDVDIENLTSALSTEGILSIEAPKFSAKDVDPAERTIPIQQATEKAITGKEGEPSEKESGKGDTNTKGETSDDESGEGDTTTAESAEEATIEKEGKESANSTTEGVSR